jgi:hypothetical protein
VSRRVGLAHLSVPRERGRALVCPVHGIRSWDRQLSGSREQIRYPSRHAGRGPSEELSGTVRPVFLLRALRTDETRKPICSRPNDQVTSRTSQPLSVNLKTTRPATLRARNAKPTATEKQVIQRDNRRSEPHRASVGRNTTARLMAQPEGRSARAPTRSRGTDTQPPNHLPGGIYPG